MYHIFVIHLSVDVCLGGFHFLVFVNNAAVNVHIQASLFSILLGRYAGVEFLGKDWVYGKTISHILRNYQTVYHSSCTILHSHKIYTGGFNISTSLPAFAIYLKNIYIVAILVSVKQNLIVVLISLLTNEFSLFHVLINH